MISKFDKNIPATEWVINIAVLGPAKSECSDYQYRKMVRTEITSHPPDMYQYNKRTWYKKSIKGDPVQKEIISSKFPYLE